MELSEILNKNIPNAGPKARAAVAEADRKLAILSESEPKRAAALKEQAMKQIASRDNGVQFTLADINRLHGSSLGRAESQSEATGDEGQIASSIEQLVNIADSRNIAIPPAILKGAANAFATKNAEGIAASSASIAKLVDDAIKIQQNEQKAPVELGDGSVAIIGAQSGTRYDNTGTPIASGNRNEQMFISSAAESYSPKSKNVMAMMSGGGDLIGPSIFSAPMESMPDVNADPSAYAAMQQPKEDARQRDIRLNAKARDAYLKGDRKKALDILRGLKATDIYGDITDETLDDYFKQIASESPAPVPAPTGVAPSNRPPLPPIAPRQ
jgi:hypothetical protein